MKVASYFTLKGDQSDFNRWLDKLPIYLRGGHRELLWLKSRGNKSVMWSERQGFIFFK